MRNKGTSGKPKISIEPDSAKSTAGNRLGTPNFNPQRDPNGKPNLDSRPDPKGTIKIDNPSDLVGHSGRVKPQSISKNGVLSTIPPKNPGPSKNDKPVDLSDNDKRGPGNQDDDVVRGLFSPGRGRKPGKGDTASLLPLGTDNDGKKPGGLDLPLGKDNNRKPRTELTQFAERDDLHRQLKKVKESPELQNKLGLQNLNLDRISGVHQDRLARAENFEHWQRSKYGTKLGLQRQFELQRQGDLSRRMNLSQNLVLAGGWTQHRQHGIVAAGFTTGAFSVWYAGGGCYPTHCWCPTWSPWVNWCWWDTCPIFYDPRPYYCIPVVYDPCPPWVFYQYPVWTPLPVVACGTWIDVSPVVVTAGQDVQLLAVRFVDNGHPENNQGPRYRVWVRNNSPIQVTSPFSVLLMASNQQTPTIETPQAGVVIPSMDIGETQVVDVRLPLSANRLGTTPEGYKVPFTYLHTLVDSHQQINETFEENNGSVVARTDILPVDPAAFSTDLTAAAPEDVLTVAGEGFGPEPGQIVVSVYGQQVQAEIQGWYDLGVRFTVPNFELSQPVDAEVLVVRGDSAVSNPISVRLAPETLLDDDSNAVRLPLPPAPQ